MTRTQTETKLLILFFLFFTGGIYSVNSEVIIQNEKALSIAFKWFSVPSVIVGAIFSYRSTFGCNRKTALWRNILGLLTLTLISTLATIISFQGYLVLLNCNVGKQKNIFVKGVVTKLNYPKRKKPLNHYAIVIKVDGKNETIKLDVPTNQYFVGQPFEKELTLGSLAFLYGK